MSSEIQLQVVRIVQEALANVRKHARATSVLVRLARAESTLEVRIEDDGQGFEYPPPGGEELARRFGLSVMRERAEAVGGEFELTTSPGRGTRILVTLPLSSTESRSIGGADRANLDR